MQGRIKYFTISLKCMLFFFYLDHCNLQNYSVEPPMLPETILCHHYSAPACQHNSLSLVVNAWVTWFHCYWFWVGYLICPFLTASIQLRPLDCLWFPLNFFPSHYTTPFKLAFLQVVILSTTNKWYHSIFIFILLPCFI